MAKLKTAILRAQETADIADNYDLVRALQELDALKRECEALKREISRLQYLMTMEELCKR